MDAQSEEASDSQPVVLLLPNHLRNSGSCIPVIRVQPLLLGTLVATSVRPLKSTGSNAGIWGHGHLGLRWKTNLGAGINVPHSCSLVHTPGFEM